MARTQNSTTIPSFLMTALGSLRTAKAGLVVPPSKMAVRTASVSTLPLTAITERKLVAHGAGVYEDPATHTIWYREGKFLKRRSQDIDRIINDYVSSIK